jgi:signal transduction histidine kinase
MPRALSTRPAVVALAAAGLLWALFAALLLHYRNDLREQIHRKMIERDAAVLHPVAQQQLAEAEALLPADEAVSHQETVLAVLRSAQQSGMLGVAVFDYAGHLLRTVPSSMLFADLAPEDYLELTQGNPISRYHPLFSLGALFAGTKPADPPAPMLEVLLPLHGTNNGQLLGVAQYFIDARPLARELAVLDTQIQRQTRVTLAVGALLILFIVGSATWGLTRAQRIIAERNTRLIRANFELALAAKASVLGQITSHLLHGLQGPVAGLRTVIAARGAGEPAEDWQMAAGYADRLQTMIQETVTMLGERSSETIYELSDRDLATALRERHRPAAQARGVELVVSGGFAASIDSNRGNLLCLIAGNLIENAVQASPAGAVVHVNLGLAGNRLRLTIADEGGGIPQALLGRLFQPGRSSKPGGTGLGLAISHLLALQISAEINLEKTGVTGTTFAVSLPLNAPA